MKILVVRLGALGDIVHTVPAVAALRRRHPAARIDWIVDERHRAAARLVQGHRRVHRHRSVGRWRELPRVVRRLRAERYDVALDFQGLLKSAVLARLSGAARVIGFERDALRERAARVVLRRARADRCRAVTSSRRTCSSRGARAPTGRGRLSVATCRAALAVDGPLRPAQPGRGLAEQAVAAGAIRRDGRVAAGPAWSSVARAVGAGGTRAGAAVADGSSGAARPAPPTRIGDVLALAKQRAPDGVGRHRAAAPRGRRRHAARRALRADEPARNGPWRAEDVSISRNRECLCHHQRRCRARARSVHRCRSRCEDVCAAIDRRLGT